MVRLTYIIVVVLIRTLESWVGVIHYARSIKQPVERESVGCVWLVRLIEVRASRSSTAEGTARWSEAATRSVAATRRDRKSVV